MTWSWTETGGITDGSVSIPPDKNNMDYTRLIESGVEILPYVKPLPTQAEFIARIDRHIDEVASNRGYSSASSFSTYVQSTNAAWAAEAAAFVAWRDAVWMKAHEELGRVLAGERGSPTLDGIVDEMPEIVWPE